MAPFGCSTQYVAPQQVSVELLTLSLQVNLLPPCSKAKCSAEPGEKPSARFVEAQPRTCT